MKEMKRIISLLLCLVMLVGYLPVNAHAEEAMTTEPSVVELSDEATGVVAEEDAAEAEENEEESLTADTGDPEEAVSEEENTSEEAPAEEETSEEVTSEEETSEEEITEEETSEEAAEEAAAFELEAAPVDVSLLDAEGRKAVVVAASDFQQRDGHTKSDSVMEGIIAAMVGAGYTDIDGALFCGDYSNGYTASESDAGLSYVYGNYNSTWELDYEDIIFVQGNHDPSTTKYLDKSGANDPASGKYGVFVIHEDDYGWASGDKGRTENEIKATAANLKTYLDQKLEAEFDEPIFVVSHLPLHYSMRTYRDGDGRYAQYIFDVLNQASVAGLNIFFLYGHNHSQSFENYHGGGAVFYSAGDEILIGTTSSKQKHHTETIQFTYLNAGYTGRFDAEDTADPTNTGTVYEIYDNKVVISRFDSKGLHNLKSAGVQSQKYYSDEVKLYAPNIREEDSPQTIELKKFAEPDVPAELVTVVHEPTGIAVTSLNLTGLDVTVNDVALPEGYSAYVSYDIKPEGYTDGKEATVVIPVDTTVFDAGRQVKVIDEKLGTTSSVSIADGKVTFTTNHFSVYAIAQQEDLNVDKWVEIPGSTTYNYKLANSFTEGGKYVIVASNNAIAMMNNSGQMGTKEVTISESTMTSDTALTEWTFNGTISNGAVYLRRNNNSLQFGTSSSNNRTWTISNQNNGYYRISNSYRYLYYTGSTFGLQYTNNNQPTVRLYTNNGSTTVPAGYAGMTGQTAYELRIGEYQDQAAVENMIRSKITVYKAADNSGTDAEVIQDYEITGTVNPSSSGEYTLTVEYGGKTLGQIEVTVEEIVVENATLDTYVGTVNFGANSFTPTGSYLTVTYSDTTVSKVPVTVGMLSGDFNLKQNGTYEGLTVTYLDETFQNYTLHVVFNDFPAYPEGGSVQVSKTGAGQDFQNTGIARVNLSTSGLPSKKGADVIVMLDTSSSMNEKMTDNPNQTRLEALKASLNVLVAQLQTKNTDGSNPDIRIAVTDFNGYNMTNNQNSAYHRNHSVDRIGSSTTGGTNGQNGINAHIFTNVNGTAYANQVASAATLNATAFQDINTIDLVNNNPFDTEVQLRSGTNYDYAFDAIYQLGEAVLAKNAENGEERDLFVIFMSDGGPFQYNYFSGNSSGYSSSAGNWNDWLNGTYANAAAVPGSGTHKYFYNGPGNSHRMADAIKGSRDQNFAVIRKDADRSSFIDVTGDGKADDYMINLPGLGATMYSIGFCIVDDSQLKKETINNVLVKIGTDEDHFYSVDKGESLNGAFAEISSQIAYAARNARFVDQMGDAFDLRLDPKIVDSSNNVRNDINNDIIVTSHPVYTKEQVGTRVNNYLVTAQDVGKTYGSGETLETVKFVSATAAYTSASGYKLPNNVDVVPYTVKADGTIDYSKATNIIHEGMICAKTFWYNTTHDTKQITLGDGSKYDLAPETFYWNIGLINEKQFTLSYAVYLTGSMEGAALPSDSYDTNNFATLHYTNWLDREVKQDVPSPALPWGAANVSYAFYLVNEAGQPVDANGNVVPNINTAYKVTQPVVHSIILLNSAQTVSSTAVASEVLPDGYTLYAPNAQYTVAVNSGTGGGSWTIGGDGTGTTYVTGHAGAQDYSNAVTANSAYDYTHTTVYFAVKWEIGTVPDAVVIDYGLPVDIHVLVNDMFGTQRTLAGINETVGGADRAQMTGFGPTVVGDYGTAVMFAAEGKIRYTPADMNMPGYEKFVYAVNYTGNVNPGYYYGDVTVIPATTIYYEDSFVDFTGYKRDNAEAEYAVNSNAWTPVGEYQDKTQSEDRPGKYSLGQIDANNVYGYDPAYNSMSTYSMGSAMMAHVDSNSYATATFDFWGTGFDIVGLTSNTTGVLTLKVTDAAGNTKTKAVDTYYGYDYGLYQVTYKKNADGVWELSEIGAAAPTETAAQTKTEITGSAASGVSEVTGYQNIWKPVPNDPNALYQVPVLQVEGLPYGHYTAVLTADYFGALDHTSADGYDLYLDAVRIYDPANDGAVDNEIADENGNFDYTIEDAYKADGEGWPSYIELRNHIIEAREVTVEIEKGEYGTITVTTPENGKINGVAFVDGVGNTSALSDYVSYGPNNELYLNPNQSVIFNLNATDSNIADVQIAMKAENGAAATYKMYNTHKEGDKVVEFNTKAGTLTSATEQYYSIKVLARETITITNNGTSGILSITNIKTTYAENPGGVAPSMELEPDDLAGALWSLRRVGAQAPEVEPSVPETTVPETTVPETTVPETTVPETTVPEETKPAKPDNSELKAAVEAAKKLKQKGYTKESFKKLETAIKAAEKVLKDKNAAQTQIDKALADLNAAVDGLETVEVKPIAPKPGASGGKIQNNFKALDSILNIFRNLLEGFKK